MVSLKLLTDGPIDQLTLFTPPLEHIITPTLSTFATLIAILNCLFTKLYNDPLQKMVLMINLADFLYCGVYASSYFVKTYTDAYCRIAFAVYNFGLQSAMIWAAMFGHGLYTYIKTRKIEKLSSNLKYYMLFAVLLPLLFAVSISLFTDYLKLDKHRLTNTMKCLHNTNGEKDYESLLYVYLPINVCFLSNLVFYTVAIKKLRRLLKEENQGGVFFLAAYPGILIVCFVPMGVGFLLTFVGVNLSAAVRRWLWSLTQLQGLFDAIVYGGGITNVCRNLKRIICICSKDDPHAESISIYKETEVISAHPSTNYFAQSGTSFREYKDSLLQ